MNTSLTESAHVQRSRTRAGGGETAKHHRRRGNKTGHNVVVAEGCRVYKQLINTALHRLNTDN